MKSKVPSGRAAVPLAIRPGDLVYLYGDRNKSRARDRYLVSSVDGSWCNSQKFTGTKLRRTSYRVRLADCYKVEGPDLASGALLEDLASDEDVDNPAPHCPDSPPAIADPPPASFPPRIDDIAVPLPALRSRHDDDIGYGDSPQEWACLRVHLLLRLGALGVSYVCRSIWRTLKFISELMFYRALQVCCVAMGVVVPAVLWYCCCAGGGRGGALL